MKRNIALAALLAAACGRLNELPTGPADGPPPVDPTATFTRVQREIFTPSCAVIGCHDPIGRQEGMVLSEGRAYASIVRVPSQQMPQLLRIDPADTFTPGTGGGPSSSSYLFRKIIGAGITGDRMPQGGPFLTQAQINLIRDWIRRGAPND
ncbi:MAG TPA: hypothetical protein VFL80_02240 [Thermoanaerobaculia bacterium]|nr:hypothetical protein [Thermoanaerobaculia bacterium]